MNVIGLDLGGTKLSGAVFNQSGEFLFKQITPLEKRQDKEVGALIRVQIQQLMSFSKSRRIDIKAIGISVPGIYYSKTGKVWAPNIPGWTNYPLLTEITAMPETEKLKVKIDSDRACYILGETWRGSARGCRDAIFLAIGTGIGAGIMVDGKILRGHNDIAGAIGWMTLNQSFRDEYKACGCFEYHASGEGIAKIARELLKKNYNHSGIFENKSIDEITSHDVFEAYRSNNPIAMKVLNECVIYWGMAVANLVSTFNPKKIIFGGGVFGPAAQFLDQIKTEAEHWAQPISMNQVSLEISTLGGDAGLIGAGRLAFMALDENF
jgi:glucokinase